ncbi:Uncharacterised protein [Streptococcus pneumoniae]|nr:Uncharacterised protein [Streptococcus pneumoniae]
MQKHPVVQNGKNGFSITNIANISKISHIQFMSFVIVYNVLTYCFFW